MNRVSKLGAAVTSAFLTLNAPAGAIWAQGALTDEADHMQSANDPAHTPAPAYNFRPEICDNIDSIVSEDVKTIAMDDERYTAIHEWQNREDAKDIFLYRLCKEDELFKLGNGNDLFSDVFFRLTDQDWHQQTVLPFIEKDPALASRLQYSRSFKTNRETGEALFVIDYEWNTIQGDLPDGTHKITYTAKAIKAVAADPERASYIFSKHKDLRDMPGFDNTLRNAVENYPLGLISYSNIISEYRDIISAIDVGPYLLQEAQNTDQPRSFIYAFENYAHLPEARDIIQAAVNRNPLIFFEAQKRRSASASLQEDGFVELPVEKLMELAADKSNASIMIAYYEYYTHLPEARDIAQTAILANSMYFIRQRNDGRLHPLLAGDSTLEISGQNLLESANSTESLYKYYQDYAHLPEAEDIARAAVQANPVRYYHHKTKNNLPEGFTDPDLMPTIEDLRAWVEKYAMSKKTLAILEYYGEFNSMEGAPSLAQDILDYNPIEYLDIVNFNKRRYTNILASGITPSAEKLMEAAHNPGLAYEVMRGFEHYKTLDASKDILQTAIRTSPLEFFSWQRNARKYTNIEHNFSPVRALLDNGKIKPPNKQDIKDIIKAKGRNFYFGQIIKVYPEIAHIEGVSEVLKSAIDANPASAFFNIINEVGGQRISGSRSYGWNSGNKLQGILPAEEQTRQILADTFTHLVLHHPDYILPKIEQSKFGLQQPLALALESGNVEVRNIVFDTFQNNPVGIFNALADPRHRDFIDTLDHDLKERLVRFSKPAIQHFSTLAEQEEHQQYYDDISQLASVFEAGSWVAESGLYADEELLAMLGYFIELDADRVIKTLEGNSTFFTKTEIEASDFSETIINAVHKSPLKYMKQVTAHEKTDDLTVLGIMVPYEDLLQSAQRYFATEMQKSSRYRHYNLEKYAVDIVNNLHNYPAEIRFALLDEMADEHYFDLVSQNDNVYYTSSFNYIMDGFLNAMQHNPDRRKQLLGDKDVLGNSRKIYTILENTLQFGRLNEFLAILDDDEILRTIDSALERLSSRQSTMDFANYRLRRVESSALMAATAEVLMFIAESGNNHEIESALVERFVSESAPVNRTILGLVAAIYSDRAEIKTHAPFFAQVRDIYIPHLARYMRTDLEAEPLFDDQGRNFQMMVFYDDQDGHASFWHFRETYNKDPRWAYRDHGEFVSYSRGGVELYANKPDHVEAANEAIRQHVAEKGGDISVLIHRGHSYHVGKTAKNYLNENVDFFWLGSCRSSVIWDYIDDAPNMQFIYSNNVGTMRVNDPLLKNINDTLSEGRNVNWLQMRDDAKRLSKGSKEVDSYVFPDGSLEYALRMVQSLYNGDLALAKATQQKMLDAVYMTATTDEYDIADYHLDTHILDRETPAEEIIVSEGGIISSARPMSRPAALANMPEPQ